MKFLDQTKISIESGKGGAGCVSFRREKYVPRGGPDGGDGGKGGDVIFRVNPGMNTLLHLSYKKNYKAENGKPGEGNQRSGANGEDLIIEVPEGTVVKNAKGKVLLDLSEKNKDYLFLKGGRGGKGNAFFKSSIKQAPQYSQPGEEAEKIEVLLELKLMADVGIIGYPNAGKSTLISALSAAKPKIADYPFTTLSPSLGMVSIEEEKTFVLADIPGLVPGAHKGVGLGTQFLRHIERTRVFVHLIDISPLSGREPMQDYQDIQKELKLYDETKKEIERHYPLHKRKQIVVLNKIDTIDSGEAEKIAHDFQEQGLDVLSISAVTRHGLQDLKYKIGEILFERAEHE